MLEKKEIYLFSKKRKKRNKKRETIIMKKKALMKKFETKWSDLKRRTLSLTTTTNGMDRR